MTYKDQASYGSLPPCMIQMSKDVHMDEMSKETKYMKCQTMSCEKRETSTDTHIGNVNKREYMKKWQKTRVYEEIWKNAHI